MGGGRDLHRPGLDGRSRASWVWINSGIAPAILLMAGGLLYIAGALCYHRRRPDPVPSVFGYHEVFHTFVGVAAACQYVAIAFFIL